MKSFIVVIWVFVILNFGFDGAACKIGMTRTIFSKSFPASNVALTLTEQCIEVPVSVRHEDVSFSSALALRAYLTWGRSWERVPIWSTWQIIKFGLPPRPGIDSLYTIFLTQDGDKEAVWDIKIPNTDVMVTRPPGPFYVSDVIYHQKAVWIFFWKESHYYLEAQKLQDNEWKNTLSVRLERPYKLGTRSATIFINKGEVGVTFTSEDEEDEMEEHWMLEGERLVLQELK